MALSHWDSLSTYASLWERVGQACSSPMEPLVKHTCERKKCVTYITTKEIVETVISGH